MAVVSMKQLLEAGVHFGHQTRRWNPKMAKYIFTERNGIYIIDLQKTVKKLDEAYNYVKEVAAEGGDILYVGTQTQAQGLRAVRRHPICQWITVCGGKTNFGGNFTMAVVSMKQLLEAGVHFGHQTRRWNPKMAKYIFTERNGIYIIDLQKTVKTVSYTHLRAHET